MPTVEQTPEVAVTELSTPSEARLAPKPAKKTPAKKAPAKAAAKNGKTPAKKAAEKAPTAKKTGLRKPQERILKALSKAKGPLSRAEVSEKAPVDTAACVEYIGSADKAVREANDAKHFPSLISLGLVKFGAPEEGTTAAVYVITPKGQKVAEGL